MRRLYSFCICVLAPLAFAVVLWRGIRNRGYWQGLGERFGFGPRTGRTPCIWLHAVSLGEVSAAAPLVRALQARHPDTPVVLTTATPTGRARARALFGGSADVRFLPYDTPGSVRRFLRRIRPRLAIIMETELWPNLFSECARTGVPLVLANARLSAKSVSRYRRFGSLFRGVFSPTTLIAAQTAEDAMRFSAIGAQANLTHVVGNVKFDQDVGPAALEAGRAIRARFWGGRPTWIAGSTHAGEEDQVLTAHAALRSQLPQALLLVVPRHPDRFDSVAELLKGRGFPFSRRSLGQAVPSETPVVLVDTVGELGALYAAADVAFVGGSLVPVGGHNLLEPAALGLPVLTGPFNSNGADILRLLVQQGAAVQVADAQELSVWLARLLEDADQRRRAGEAGRRAVEANRGSVARLLELIEPLLAAAGARP
jgi:3-deoxy-D-manno-octulosonic-acid transferase